MVEFSKLRRICSDAGRWLASSSLWIISWINEYGHGDLYRARSPLESTSIYLSAITRAAAGPRSDNLSETQSSGSSMRVIGIWNNDPLACRMRQSPLAHLTIAKGVGDRQKMTCVDIDARDRRELA